ncbi:MFS transporter [Buchananella felis]|uniref:MFS transporter n=1 Tax=Buchananella felis TaxID=3231492 RepID=UPI0035295633
MKEPRFPLSANAVNYYRWLVADTSLSLGAAFRAFALPVLVFLATGSESQAGIIQATATAVSGASLLAGGVIVDHFDRRKLVMVEAATGIVVTGAAIAWALAFGLSFWLLLVVGVLMALRAGLLSTATDTLLRDVVPPKELPSRMAMNEGRDAAIQLGGGPLAGGLVTWHWLSNFAAELVLNALALVTAARIRLLPEGARAEEDDAAEDTNAEGDADPAADATDSPQETGGLISRALAGFKLLAANQLMRRFAVLAVLFNPFLNGFFLYLLLSTLKTSGAPISAAFFNSVSAIGMLLGAAAATRLVKRFPTGKLIAFTFTVPVVCAVSITLAPSIWVKLALIAPMLFLVPAANSAFGGFYMLMIPKRMLGRVWAAAGVGNALIAPLVSLGLGYSLEHLGPTPTGLLLAAGMAPVALFTITSRDTMAIPLPDQWEDYLKTHGLTLTETP